MKRLCARIAVLGVVAGSLVFPAASTAQESSILQGKVMDAATGEPLVGAQVAVAGTAEGAITDVDGRYRLHLPPGAYDLRVAYLGYADKTVTRVQVTPGQPNVQDITLQSEAIQAEAVEVVVSAEEERGSVIGALARQRRATNVVNGISAEEIAATPASNAADAVARVQSTSIVDGKYVYVRGLGERYSTALLDGSGLPTPEPEKRVIPLDLFPASMIESLFTVKSYTADLPGDFAGGLVDIRTKDIPEQAFFSFSTGVGYNTNLGDLDRPTYEGGALDWLGFDDGTRGLPAGFPDRIPVDASRDRVAELHSRFEGNFSTIPEAADLGDADKSFSLSFGAPVRWLDRDGGYLFGLSYSNSANARVMEEFFPSQEEGRFQYDFTSLVGRRDVSLGLIGGYAINPTPTSRVSLKAFFTQSAEDDARLVTGLFDQSTSGFARITRFQFIERSLFSNQLRFEHKLGFLGDSKLEWDGSYAVALRDEPDTRTTAFVATSAEAGDYFFNEAGNNDRFFSDLQDDLSQGGVKMISQFDLFGRAATLDTGVRAGYRTREFEARRFDYENAAASVRAQPAEQLFTSQNIAAGNIQFLETTEPTDRYDATELSSAGYASLGFGLSDDLRLSAGVRLEHNETRVESFDPRTGTLLSALNTDLTTWEPLPALTLQWQLGGEQSLRAAAARTIVRPQFRELAPFRYDDYQESTLGNPFLENGEIYNFDLRWSLFPSLGEIVSVGGFYKIFNDPIEIVRLPTGGTNVGTPEPYNAPRAETYGIELELRHDLGRWAPLTGLGASASATFADSRVDQDEPVEVYFGSPTANGPDILSPEVFTSSERPLFGQSSFLVNASVNYTTESGGTTATLLYNGVGERLAEVGTNNFDDIYEQDRHTFDAILDQRIWNALDLKLAIENITGEAIEFRLGDDVTERYRPGRELSVKASYAF